MSSFPAFFGVTNAVSSGFASPEPPQLPRDLVLLVRGLPRERMMTKPDALRRIKQVLGLEEHDDATAQVAVAKLVAVGLAHWQQDPEAAENVPYRQALRLVIHDPQTVQKQIDEREANKPPEPPYRFEPFQSDPEPQRLDPVTRTLTTARPDEKKNTDV